jgi:rare lipoprotein A (peptidoglycan hydrolase)
MEKSTFSLKNLLVPAMLLSLISSAGYNFSLNQKQKNIEAKLVEAKIIISPTPTPSIKLIKGKVSFYDNTYCEKYNPGCITASGEKFDENKLTFACGSDLKLGTKAKFYYHAKAGEIRTVVATCNDRGSFGEKYDRLADLSKATFASIAQIESGVVEVEMEVLE